MTPTAVEDTLSAEISPETAEQIAQDADSPIHRARCVECATAVDYRAMASGRGFMLVDADPDAVFGVGPNGRPTCPNGHGEMSIADDTLKPASEAFAEVAAQLESAQQASLPGVFPAFDFAAVFKEIVEQAQTVERLKADSDAAKQEAADAKKALDKGAELLMRMTLEFERRRKEKAAGPPEAAEVEPGPRLIECTWEAQHDGKTCVLCSFEFAQNEVTRILGSGVAAADAEAHVDDVERFLTGLQTKEALDMLESIDTYLDTATIAGWSREDRAAVIAWAHASYERAQDQPDFEVPDRPKVLGKPHIPAARIPDERQVCSICEVVLASAVDEGYKVTDYVGVDCSGRSPEPHRYPETSKKKAAKKPAAKAKQ